jgi:predicted Holliday junction resolvase-like endonuclease
LFDGRKKFPVDAEARQSEMEQQLEERLADLMKRQQRATIGSEKTAIAVGIGKIVEKILPAHKDFKMVASDCRFLAEPIDMIAFQGLSENRIQKITFLDIKTGNAKLNTHQKQIRDAVKDGKVKWSKV